MANNIVQLKDKDDNNIYPLAGGMAADSITTAMLQDGAVTSDKVQPATLDVSSYAYNSTQFPINYAEIKSRGGIHTLNLKGHCNGFGGGYVLAGLPISPSRQMAVAVYSDQVVNAGVQSRVGYLTSGGSLELEGRSFANNEEIIMTATWVD